MKKLCYFLVFATSFCVGGQSYAQCTISDLSIRSTNINTNTSEVTFDLSWTQEINNGNKFAYIHLWTQAGYHTPLVNWGEMYDLPGASPKAGDLVNALATIVIADNHSNTPLIGSVYQPDPSYELPSQSGLSIMKIHLNNTLIERMTVQNIKIKLPSLAGAQTLTFDVWASQSVNGKNVHCVKQGANIIVNEINVTGLMQCTNPAGFQVIIENNGLALTNVRYKVYLDYPPVGILNLTDTVIYSVNSINLPANSTYTSPVNGYLPFSANNYSSVRSLIVEVTVPERFNSVVATIQNGCGPLPVKFNSFSVIQVKDKVLLNWQTATEQNNRGFEIQRKLAGDNFRAIAFVPTNALNGSSEVLINYSYNDIQNLAGISHAFYWIKQIDLDGKSTYSEIRDVNLKPGNNNLLIYPNPSRGMINIIIPTAMAPVDIVLNSMGGKEISRWKGVLNHHFQIDKLPAGIYSLSFFAKKTGEKIINKIVVE